MSSDPPERESDQVVAYLDDHPTLVPLCAAALVTLVAIGPWPYDYYVLLRILLTVTGGFIIVNAIAASVPGWSALGATLIVLWAPPVLVVLPRDVWIFLDIVAAGVLVAAGLLITRKRRAKSLSWLQVALIYAGVVLVCAWFAWPAEATP